MPGDRVFSYDLAQERTQADVVVVCYANIAVEFVSINDELEVTRSHPFLTVAGEWKRAGELNEGEWVRGSVAPIQITSIVARTEPKTMFNFEVTSSRSYCVSGDGTSYFVVHNGK